jgi:hypothetical protein
MFGCCICVLFLLSVCLSCKLPTRINLNSICQTHHTSLLTLIFVRVNFLFSSFLSFFLSFSFPYSETFYLITVSVQGHCCTWSHSVTHTHIQGHCCTWSHSVTHTHVQGHCCTWSHSVTHTHIQGHCCTWSHSVIHTHVQGHCCTWSPSVTQTQSMDSSGNRPDAKASPCTTHNTQQSQQRTFHSPRGILNRNPSKRPTADSRLRPRGHCTRV